MVDVSDTYTRSVTDDWGTADTGGAWTILAGTAANFDVNGTKGTILTPTASVQQLVHLASVSVLSIDIQVEVTFPAAAPSGANEGHFAYLILRRQAGGQYYRIGLFNGENLNASSRMGIRGQNASGVSLFTDADTGLVHTAGETYVLRCQAIGSLPTFLSAKVWRLSAFEPPFWNVTITDYGVGPQVAGSAGVRTIATNTAPQVTFSFDNMTASTVVTPAAVLGQADATELIQGRFANA